MAEQQPSFKQSLGLLDSTMIVAGSMIGSGIFIVSADITRNVGSAGWLIAVWLITGFMTITAAVSYGELSGMYPKAGGQYVYLKEAYNPLAGFLYGWSFFAVIQTATIAAVGVAFSKFLAYLVPQVSEDLVAFSIGGLKISPAQLLSIALIVFLTFINTRGVKAGKLIQTTFTVTKLLSLFGLIIFGLIMMKGDVWDANWSNDAWHLHALNSTTDYTMIAALSAVAAAMVGSIFSSDAWNNVTFIAAEIKNPKRNIGLALFFGTLIVSVIYITTNVMYTAVLPMNEIASAEKDRVAGGSVTSYFWNLGTVVIALMIMISTFGCNNGLILAGARVYYTMAKDGLFFKPAGTLNGFAVPQWALWFQCLIACAWSVSGKYGQLLDMISFVAVLFYVLTIVGIFILRKKYPNAERPYKAFGYPLLPIIYIIAGIAFCVLLIIYKPAYAVIGLAITLAGIPLYYIAVATRKKTVTV
jgi:APA family basic amino acid/polyamine antiporter